ncbi:MAG: hypothetical protein SH819_01755 [Cytophagales bacterium]|nr:hypothetical protein [Cytophagales bacterium]
MSKRVIILLVVGLAISSCTSKLTSTEGVQEPSLNWEALAGNIMERCNLQKGERVILIGLPGRFDPLVPLLENMIFKRGGIYLGTLSVDTVNVPENWKTDFVRATEGKSREDLVDHFGDIDLGIMLPGATPAHVPYAAMQEVLTMGKGRTIHFHWSGAYDMQGLPIEIDPRVDKVYTKALLETDYNALASIQRQFEEAARSQEIVVTTPAGTNIRLSIGDRAMTRQDGNASLTRTQYAQTLIDREVELPAGAIRVAPIEESVNGTIAFPDGVWNGQRVQGLVLTFINGKVSDMKATAGLTAVKEELGKAGEAGRSFREIAVGFNPLLDIPSDKTWIPYYGYGAGVVRLSLGDNTELGGNVSGGYVRWNFFTDATVIVGGDTWIKDGKQIR